MRMPVQLGRTVQGYVAPRPDVPIVRMTLGDIPSHGLETYHASAVQRVIETVRDFIVEQHLLGVYVAPDPLQITESGQDLRKPTNGRNPLTLIIATATIGAIRIEAYNDDGDFEVIH